MSPKTSTELQDSPSLKKSKKSRTVKTPKESPSQKKPKSPPPLKSPKPEALTKIEVKSESPEKKPKNGQSDEIVEEKDDSKTLKIQSAGAGQAGADYNPSKKKYHPIKDAFWKRGEK